MKQTNSIIQDRKEEIEKLNQRVATLQGFYDEQEEILAAGKKKNEDAMKALKEEKDAEV